MVKRLMICALVAVMAVPIFVSPVSARAPRIDVRAVDYDLKGIPAELKVGPYRFAFENKGEHAHELVILRKRATSDLSWEEIFSLPRKEAEKHVVFVGFTFAKPGQTGKTFRAYLKAGKYISVCFFQNDKHSEPHYFKGMFRKFHVSR